MSVGLDDVVAAETSLSSVDGARGVLIVRGLSLAELAGHKSFEDLSYLLFEGQFADLPRRGDFAAALGAARVGAFTLTRYIDASIAALAPMDAVRALVARMEDGEDFATAIALLAAPAVVLPAVLRVRQGLSPVAPDPTVSQAGDMLRMLDDRAPTPEANAFAHPMVA